MQHRGKHDPVATFLKRVADMRFKMSVNLQRNQSASMYHKNRLYSTTDGVETGDEQCINWKYPRKNSLLLLLTIAKTIAATTTKNKTNNTLDFYCVALFKKLSALI